LTRITRSLVACDPPDLTGELSQKALERGKAPLTIINRGMVPEMEIVGERFQTEGYFLPK